MQTFVIVVETDRDNITGTLQSSMDLSEKEKCAVKLIASDTTESFSLGVVTGQGDVDGIFDFESEDGSVNVEHMGEILAAQIAATAAPGEIEEYCNILAERATEIQDEEPGDPL